MTLCSTLTLLAALACAPKTPPPGSVELTLEAGEAPAVASPGQPPAPLPIPVLTGAVPLPLGVGRPWEGEPMTEAQRAFVEAEAALRDMQDGLEAAMSLAEALSYTERAEHIRSLLRVASLETELGGPAAARMGDAQRIAGAACAAAGADEDEGFDACAPLLSGAGESYLLGLELTGEQPQWRGHITWALQNLSVAGGSYAP